MKMPPGLEFRTADEVAECLDYGLHLPAEYGGWEKLYGRLWGFLAEASNPTPLGGDGSDGTVEHPDGRRDLANDDKARHWWAKLDPVEQRAVAEAYRSETDG